jgi:spore maturation protein CgeB
VFEAAGAGACLITDRWRGIEMFLEPGREVLVADDGAAVAAIVRGIGEAEARRIGAAARRRVLAEHTYRDRALAVERALALAAASRRARVRGRVA